MEKHKGIINELIQKRRSPLAFDKKPVEEVKIMRLFEAARWAPSSRNEQPWRFIYATKDDDSVFGKMIDILAEGNRIWAKDVPLMILSLAKIRSSYSGKQNYYAFHDTGMAVGNLLIQATDMGLVVHQMGGYDKEKAISLFGIPEDYEPVAMIAAGYQGDPQNLPAELQKREQAERTRVPLDNFVFRGSWKEQQG